MAGGGGARTAVGVVLVFLAGVCASFAAAAAWTRTELRDEDTWAATSRAVADDPQLQRDVADALARRVIEVAGVQGTLEGVLPGPLGGLAEPLSGAATDGVSRVAVELVRTDAFVQAWELAVRDSQEELLAALDGEGRYTAVTSEGVVLDLGSTLGQFRRLLDDRGLTFLDGVDLSAVEVQFVLVDGPGLQHVRDLLRVLDVLVVVLPAVAVGATVVGLLVARRRSMALAAGGLGALAGAGLVYVAAEAGRAEAVQRLTGGVLGAGAARAVVDHVTSSLDTTLAMAAAAGAVVLVVGGVAAAVTARR